MSTTAKMAKYKKQMAALSAHKAEMAKPEGQRDASKVLRRDLECTGAFLAAPLNAGLPPPPARPPQPRP